LSASGLRWEVNVGMALMQKLTGDGHVGEKVIEVRKLLGRTWKGTKILARTTGVPTAE